MVLKPTYGQHFLEQESWIHLAKPSYAKLIETFHFTATTMESLTTPSISTKSMVFEITVLSLFFNWDVLEGQGLTSFNKSMTQCAFPVTFLYYKRYPEFLGFSEVHFIFLYEPLSWATIFGMQLYWFTMFLKPSIREPVYHGQGYGKSFNVCL